MNVFRNPIISGFNPDPSITRAGSDFFLTTSTFEYFPGLPIYHSTDLLDWKLVGHALTRKSQLDMRTVEPGAGIWAPTLRWRKDEGGENGRFYLATCSWNRYRPKTDERIFPCGFYVYTDNIWNEDSWSEPIYFDNPGFDQDLFWDDDGKVYLSTTTRLAVRPSDSKLKDFAIHISQIELSTGNTLTAPKVIRASPHGLAEGSHIIKRGTFYYLFTAEGGTESGHHEVVLRCTTGPLGPWIIGPSLWYNGLDEEVQNTGHADVFEDAEGEWWAVMLGVRPQELNGQWKDSQLGRETYLVKVTWKDDWPIFNYGKNISLLTEGKDGRVVQKLPPTWKADFSKPELEPGWYKKHTPLKQFYVQNHAKNSLTVYGGCYDLRSPEAPTLLLRKQTAFHQSFTADLDFLPNQAGSEAGIVIWYSMYTFSSIGLRRSRSGIGLEMILRMPKPGEGHDFLERHWPLKNSPSEGDLRLTIKGDGQSYLLTSTSGDSQADLQVLGRTDGARVPVDLMMRPPPVGGMFTGMAFGIYSFGFGGPCLDPAIFSNISVTTFELQV